MTQPHAPLRAPAPGRLAAVLAAAFGLALPPPGAAGDVPSFNLKEIPATLVYTIDIAGHARKENAKAGTYFDDTVHQRLDGTVHLIGRQGDRPQVDNAQQMIQQTASARRLMAPAIEKAMATCGEDEACMKAAIWKMSAGMERDHRDALAQASKAKARFSEHGTGEWTLDTLKPRCSLHAVAQGTSRYRTIDAGEGYSNYVTGSKQRHGEGREDCATKAMPDLPEARASWNGDTRTLRLALPGLAVEERIEDSDGGTDTAKVAIPDVTLDDLRWSGQGPQSGQQKRQVEAGGIPATMTIRWTFTPGKA